MDRETMLRFVAAIGLSLLVMIAWNHFFPTRPPVRPPAPTTTSPSAPPSLPSAAAAPAPPTAVESGAAAVAAAPALPVIAGPANQPPLIVDTRNVTAQLSARGGRLLSWKLKRYPRVTQHPEQGPIDMVSPEARALDRDALTLETGDPAVAKALNEAWYLTERSSIDAEEARAKKLPVGTTKIVFRWSDSSGLAALKQIYIPDDDHYLLRVEWLVTQGGKAVTDAHIIWGPSVGPMRDVAPSMYHYRGRVSVALGPKVERREPAKMDGDVSYSPGSGPAWLAVVDEYFAVALLPEPNTPARVQVVANPIPASAKIEPKQAILAVGGSAATLYAGPKSETLLRNLDADLGTSLSGLVDWGYFGVVAKVLYPVLQFLHGLVNNWGVAIILITVLIKVLFYPLTQRAMVNMRKTQKRMADLQPKIRRLKEKYEGKRDMESRRLMNEETMALYQKEGINPMAPLAGCLPLLLQLPVLWGLLTVFQVNVELRGAPFFGWIKDLSSADPYWVTPVVMGVSMLLQQLMTMTKTDDPQQKAQQRMMLIMPAVFTFMFLNMPSGLVLYWLVNNLLSIGQQVLINRQAEAKTA